MKKFNAEKMSGEVIDIIENLADVLEIEPHVFIENIIIKRLADDRAADDVYNDDMPQLMPEFMKYDGELKRGRELYKILYNLERQRLEIQYIDNLAAVPVEALTDNDREILKRHGKLPEQQAAQAKEKESVEVLRKKYNVPRHKPGTRSHWES